ncbi:AAA domain-containing protein [Helicobacter pametensis]|uniref:AAA domain-containing protein n=1 Tax=Helicobacter pametensis TaxID=95149 RepID=UPI0004B38B94|nr:AAA domain-containing protein [Helicobacter pametensis]
MEIFQYLKEISQFVGPTYITENGKQRRMLYDFCYSKIDYPKNLLDNFCKRCLNREKRQKERTTIYPFGFNLSQKKAIDEALQNSISIIEGPPGTGKTQTILNIIANVVLEGKSVAVVSNNNSAIQNIEEKLRKYSLDFICAKLGSFENKKHFIQSQREELPQIGKKSYSAKELKVLHRQLQEICIGLDKKLLQQNQLFETKRILSSLQIEKEYFKDYLSHNSLVSSSLVALKINSSQMASKILSICRRKQSLKKIVVLIFLRFWDRSLFLFYRLIKELGEIDKVTGAVQERFYDLKVLELSREIKNLEKDLKRYNFKERIQESTRLSLEIFSSFLQGKYSKNRKSYTLEDLFYKSDQFLKDYPLILSTTYSIYGSLSKKVSYDYLIMDEASQVDLCTGALALHCSKNAVIVGDTKQLSNIVPKEQSKIFRDLFKKYSITESYRYETHSFLSCIAEVFPQIPKTLLREHYRCHPKIIEFCNQKFYNGNLVILTEEKEEDIPLVLYKTVKGNHQRDYINQRQIDVIEQEIINQYNLNIKNNSVGIIAPYRAQVGELRKVFGTHGLKIDTVDSFQGQESQIIILSTVNNKNSEFIDNPNRLNVAISRAVEKLIVVINDDESLIRDGNIGDLVRYIQYHNFEIRESKIFSIFDFLYQCYTQERLEFLARYKKVSRFDSENLIFYLLKKILKLFPSFDFAMHVPLKMIIKDTNLLNKDEKKFIFHPNTHVDFLIFSKIDKMPKLIIEVDGSAFHKEESRQFLRDRIKDGILKKYHLDFLRLKTDGSQEEAKIIEVLNFINGSLR